MAANAVIGSLRVNLGIDSAQFKSGLKSANSGMQSFTNQMKVMAAGAAAGLAALSAGLMRAAGRADDMGKVAQKVGLPIEELSRLKHAAEMSGVSFDTLQGGIRKLSAAMADLTDKGSPALKALERMGISARDTEGNMKPTSDVLAEIADRFASMPDGAQKTALAIATLGKSGADMIPMLNGGSAGLKAMGEQAERLGLVIDQKTATASERFNDNLALLGKSMDGVFNKVLAHVAPAFEALSFRMMDAVHSSGVLDSIAKVLAGTMNVLARTITVVFDNLHHLYDLMKVYVAAKAVTYTVALAGTFVQMAKAVRVAGLAMAAFTTITRAKITTLALLGAVVAKVTGTYDGMIAKLQEMSAAVMTALPDSMREGIDSLTAGFKKLTGEIGAVDNEVAKNLGTYLGLADDAAASFGKVGAKGSTAAKNITDAWAGVRTEIENTKEPLESVGEGFQTFANGLANAFSSALDGSKKLSDSLRDLLKQVSSMMLNSAFKMLFGGMFGGPGAGALLGGIHSNNLRSLPCQPSTA
jgi:uncharacterized phage infection (PIP) family protein YhgE